MKDAFGRKLLCMYDVNKQIIVVAKNKKEVLGLCKENNIEVKEVKKLKTLGYAAQHAQIL